MFIFIRFIRVDLHLGKRAFNLLHFLVPHQTFVLVFPSIFVEDVVLKHKNEVEKHCNDREKEFDDIKSAAITCTEEGFSSGYSVYDLLSK